MWYTAAENAADVAVAADFFQITSLQHDCAALVKSTLSVKNCVKYFCALWKFPEEAEQALKMICRNFNHLCRGDDLQILDFEAIRTIFSSPELSEKNEFQVFEAMCRCVKMSNLSEDEIDQLLTDPLCSRYTSMAKSRVKNILKWDLIKKNEVRRAAVKKGLEFHANVYTQPIALEQACIKPRSAKPTLVALVSKYVCVCIACTGKTSNEGKTEQQIFNTRQILDARCLVK